MLFSKFKNVLRSLNDYIQNNGGPKKALPKILSKALYAFKNGGFGHLKNIFRSFVSNSTAFHNSYRDAEQLPSLLNELMEQNSSQKSFSPNAALLNRILDRENHPVCIIDHQYGGGANKYRELCAKELLAQGRAVVILSWDIHQCFINGLALHNGLQLNFVVDDIDILIDQKLFKFNAIIVNSIAMWSTKKHYKQDYYVAVQEILLKIVRLATAHSAETSFLFHDFYPVCPKYTLIDYTNKYCGIPIDKNLCKTCLSSTYSQLNIIKNTSFLNNWRNTWQAFFDTAKEIRFFSQSSQEIAQKIFSFRPRQSIVVPHRPLIAWNTAYSIPPDSPMVIGVVGNISFAKGARILRELSWLLDKTQRLVIIGNIEQPEELAPNVVVTGSYELASLPDILAQYKVTIGFIPSICPETFSYVTQECMNLGLPLVCFNIGAPAERISRWEHGLVVEEISAENALKALNALDSRRK